MHCRAGSLEKDGSESLRCSIVHCRTGSLETYTETMEALMIRALPYRQLRNMSGLFRFCARRALPYRQLSNGERKRRRRERGALPYRQPKSVMRDFLLVSSCTAAQVISSTLSFLCDIHAARPNMQNPKTKRRAPGTLASAARPIAKTSSTPPPEYCARSKSRASPSTAGQ